MFSFCIRLKKDVTRNVIESLLELDLDDSLLYSLEKEYSTGGTQQQRQQQAVGVGGKSILKDKKKQMKGKQFNLFVDFLYDYALIAEGGSPKDPSRYLRQLDKYLS